MSVNDALPYRIEPGDRLVLHTSNGALMLQKCDDLGFVNLNEMIFGVAKENHRGFLKQYVASQFAVLCDILAGSRGLRCADVRPEDGGSVYSCRIESI